MRSLLLLALPGCVVVDAPDNIEALMVFGFTRFDDAAAVPAASELRGLVDVHDEALAAGLRIDSLSTDDLASAGIDVTLDDGILGMATRVGMSSGLDDVAWAWSHPRMDEVLSTTLEFEIHEERGDRDCFLAHDCDRYAIDGWRMNDLGLFGTSEQTFTREYRWLELRDGGRVLTTRELVPDGSVMSGDLLRLHAQFAFTAFYDDGAGTLRVDAFWVDAELLGAEVPDYFALESSVKQVVATAAEVDAFIEGR